MSIDAGAALAPMHSAHLVGPYDWDASLLPRAEYDARLGTLLGIGEALGLAGIIVHGNPRDHGTLAWVSGLVPRMGMPAWAFLAKGHAPRLGLAGLPTPRQTWIEDMRLVRDLKQEIGDWLGAIGLASGKPARIGLCGAAALTEGAYQRLAAALGTIAIADDHYGPLAELRQVKSEREQGLIARAAAMLETAFAAFGAVRGSGLRKAAIEAKRAAYAAGAQDVVLLASLSDGGLPLPLDGIEEAESDPLHLSLAVRHAGYWARGLASFGTANSAAAACAAAALSGLIELMRPRLSVASLTVAAPKLLGAYRAHPLTAAGAAAGIGLSLEEFPSEPNTPLVAGGVYALRVGAAGEGGDQALASAMIALNADGAHVLWRSPAPGRSLSP
jgi:hypothetical protein